MGMTFDKAFCVGKMCASPPSSSSSLEIKKMDGYSSYKLPLSSPMGFSPVPCYTCRRRHVKCDGIRPTCAKCAKKGVACLGYRKPLKWVGGSTVNVKRKENSQTGAEYGKNSEPQL